MTWRAEIRWGAEIVTVDDIDFDLEERLDLFADTPVYQPLRLRLAVAWPRRLDLASFALAHTRDAVLVRLTQDGEPQAVLFAESVRTQAGVVELACSDAPDRQNRLAVFPPRGDYTARVVDQSRRAELRAAAFEIASRPLQETKATGKAAEQIEREIGQLRNAIDEWTPYGSIVVAEALYPFVVGSPGERDISGGTPASHPGAPATVYDASASKLLVDGKAVHAPDGGRPWVTLLRYAEAVGFEEFEYYVDLEEDAAGRIISTVTVDDANLVTELGGFGFGDYDDELFFTAWRNANCRGTSGHPIDVIRLLLRLAGMLPDEASLEAQRDRLRGYDLATFANAEAAALDVLERDVMPLLPVVLAPTPYGTGLVSVDTDAAPVADLVSGEDLHPIEAGASVSMRRPRLVNAAGPVGWGWSPWRRTWTTSRASLAVRTWRGVASRARHGTQAAALQTAWSWDRATVEAAAKTRVGRQALVQHQRMYEAHHAQLASRLGLGSVVLLTDADVGLTRGRAVVVGRRRTRLGAELTLAFDELQLDYGVT